MRRLLTLSVLVICTAMLTEEAASGQSASDEASNTASPMNTTGTGTFEVAVNPQPADDYADGRELGRMTIDKQYRGDLEAEGRGQMLTGMTVVEGSAAYVAMERVDGVLAGRRGSFILHHRGRMSAGDQQLEIQVVPDSGTGDLVGLEGRMTIVVKDGVHHYEFAYNLP